MNRERKGKGEERCREGGEKEGKKREGGREKGKEKAER